MVQLLADPMLYEHTGGEPPTVESLRQRYVRQMRGVSPTGNEAWLNWIISDASSHAALGYVQATIPLVSGPRAASLAWLVGTTFQCRGVATRATALMISVLRAQGIADFRASIAHGHVASERVAHRAGMSPTEELDDGEVVWHLSAPLDSRE